MNKIKYILPVLFLSLVGCTADETVTFAPVSEAEQPLEFRSFVGSKGSGQIYESEYFKSGDQIRVYCPRVYSAPSFEDGAPGMYIYEYSATKQDAEDNKWENWPYEFKPQEGTSGFDWRTLEPTGPVYMFEVLHFPGKDFMEEVPDRQDKPYPNLDSDSPTSISGLEAADMLIAHRRHPVEDKEKTVPLTFYHAFAMVEVTVELPFSEVSTGGLFPKDALQEVYMRQMLTHYTVDYSSVIASDTLRVVKAIEGGERKDIYMKSDDLKGNDTFVDKDQEGQNVNYQRFVYRGIVPAQSFLDEGNNFLFFKVKRNDGSDGTTLYRFKFSAETAGFSLKASKILSIKVRIDNNTNEVVVMTAEIKPWIKADGEFDIFPEK